MFRKGFLLLILIACFFSICVARGQEWEWESDMASLLPPMYSTAIHRDGFTVGLGSSYQTTAHIYVNNETSREYPYFFTIKDKWYHRIRPAVSVSYGFTNWIAAIGRGGMYIDIPSGETRPAGGLGIKLATPFKKYFSAALTAEADYPNWFVGSVMLGGVTGKGHELVTLGCQIGIRDWETNVCPYYLFVNLHPLEDLHIVGGFSPPYFPFYVSSFGNGFYAGLGYTYNIAPQVKKTRIKIVIEEPIEEL